jgi:hypothetical protein
MLHRAIRAFSSKVPKAATSAAEKAQQPAWRRLLLLLATPGTGQVRTDLDPISMRRLSDPQITSHAAFVPGIIAAATTAPPLPELAALQSSVLLLSLAYHRNYERPGLLAQGEGFSAKLLFLYGTTQTLTNCPADQPALLVGESCCLALTLGAFVVTNFNKDLYERWHPVGLHVVPGVWSTLVALGHTSLLPIAFVAAT